MDLLVYPYKLTQGFFLSKRVTNLCVYEYFALEDESIDFSVKHCGPGML